MPLTRFNRSEARAPDERSGWYRMQAISGYQIGVSVGALAERSRALEVDVSGGFDSREEFPSSPGEQEIRSIPDVPEELKSELVKRAGMFVDYELKWGHGTRFRPPQVGWKHWVVRREQLDLLKQLSPVAAGIVAYAAVAAASPCVLTATALSLPWASPSVCGKRM